MTLQLSDLLVTIHSGGVIGAGLRYLRAEGVDAPAAALGTLLAGEGPV